MAVVEVAATEVGGAAVGLEAAASAGVKMVAMGGMAAAEVVATEVKVATAEVGGAATYQDIKDIHPFH